MHLKSKLKIKLIYLNHRVPFIFEFSGCLAGQRTKRSPIQIGRLEQHKRNNYLKLMMHVKENRLAFKEKLHFFAF